jgi:hypothetical protein
MMILEYNFPGRLILKRLVPGDIYGSTDWVFGREKLGYFRFIAENS